MTLKTFELACFADKRFRVCLPFGKVQSPDSDVYKRQVDNIQAYNVECLYTFTVSYSSEYTVNLYRLE